MAKISPFPAPADLLSRRAITVEIPEFLLRAFECRLAEANEHASAEERVELEDLIELQLAEGLSLAEVARLEREVPGIGAAVCQWLAGIE